MRPTLTHPGRPSLVMPTAALAAAAILAVLAAPPPARADEGRTVFYQVTYTNGSSRDLPTVPGTNKGILYVLRITRIEQGDKGYEILSTGSQPVTMVNRGQTYRTSLKWDGKAWVAPCDEPGVAAVMEIAPTTAPTGEPDAGDRKRGQEPIPPQGARPSATSGNPEKAPDPSSGQATRVKAALMDLTANLLESHDKLAAAEKRLHTQDAPAAATVAKARDDIRTCLAIVMEATKKLSPAGEPAAAAAGGTGVSPVGPMGVPPMSVGTESGPQTTSPPANRLAPGLAPRAPAAPGGPETAKTMGETPMAPTGKMPVPPPPAPASGQVVPATRPPSAKTVNGIALPVRQVASLPCRVQVWPLPDGQGQRTSNVSIEHPEAGPAGAFYYVAYADTDGNGKPDRLIARSPLAQADVAGQWTQWQFTTDQKTVFVGKAWDRTDTVHYYTQKIEIDDNWRGLGNQCYVSLDGWLAPQTRWGPCYGNLRVWTEGQ